MADPIVHITEGVPDGGTGNITTLGQTLVDGANVTMGAKADTAVTATDTTPGSIIALLKGIISKLAGTLTATVSGTVGVSNFPATQPVSAASLPLPTGAAQDTTVSALVSTTDFDTKVGALTETAPATDTASSGLNGRLQRIAQRLSSLIALLPAAFGAGGGLKVDGSGTALPVSGTVTANAGTGSFASTLADGASVTLGAKADAKNAATDTTAITAMSVWKQISASVQAIATSIAGTLTVATHAVTQSGTWNVTVNAAIAAGSNVIGGITAAASAFADGALVTIGLKADAANAATDTTAISAMQVWKQISKTLQGFLTNSTGLFARLSDGTNNVTVKAGGSGSPAASDVALAVTLRDVNANGQSLMANAAPVVLPSDQKYETGMSPRAFSAAFTTLTRPANQTLYSAADSMSNSGTAGSVTALSATVSDTNDDPLTLTEILIVSTDTGLAGKRIRAYLFNSDPTASSGVGGGDNAAFSQKQAGYIGSMSGVLETGFSDGTVGRLVPSYNDGAASGTPNAAAGGFIVSKPTSGAKTLFVQYQTLDAFTPSANSTTIIGTIRGFQGRAA